MARALRDTWAMLLSTKTPTLHTIISTLLDHYYYNDAFRVVAPSGLRGGRSGVFRGSGGPARCVAAYPPATAATPPVRTVPGAASHAPPGTPPSTRGQALGTGDPGHLFPPSPAASPAGTLRPAGTWLCGDASRPNSGSRTRPALRRFSVSNSVSIRHREPPTYARVSNGISSGALDR